jgi:Mlc titration factor MtfA (ptsG expression regulator)
MSAYYFLVFGTIAAVLVFLYPGWRRSILLARPFPVEWFDIVKRKLPFYARMQPDEQQQLLDLIRLFVADKTFYGCKGLQITDEIRITIAAQACLLLLNRHTRVFPDLHFILVYPYAFRAGHEQHNPDGTVIRGQRELLGESWQYGKVILSWDDVEAGVADFRDGHNVVLHEFSHQLDSEDGLVNGAPVMRHSKLKTWADVFSREFADLIAAADNQQLAVMDPYGASSPAEFFAVATETFFEKPAELAQMHPHLYAELGNYYKVDPRKWQ